MSNYTEQEMSKARELLRRHVTTDGHVLAEIAELVVCDAMRADPINRSPSYDALLLVAQSVCGALSRAGINDCDDPGEAIDVMRERLEKQISALRTASQGKDHASCQMGVGCDEQHRCYAEHNGIPDACAIPLIAPGGSGGVVAWIDPSNLADHMRSEEGALRYLTNKPKDGDVALYTARAGVDLEQFRDVVLFFKERVGQLGYMDASKPKFLAKADRLLALIDANKQESGNG